MQRPRCTETGFTLVELLVVVVILGILSAVVVFAVRGASDKGQRAAIGTDERIIRTAEETHCAQHGTYVRIGTSGDQPGESLIGSRLLTTPPIYHTVDITSPVPCNNGTGLPIKCADGSPMPDCGLTTPPVTSWVRTTTDPLSFARGVAVQLPTGKVLALFSSDFGAATVAQLYDPFIDTWSVTSPPPGGSPNSATLITGTFDQCGINCGKVLVQLFSFQNIPWQLYDPLTGTWSPTSITNKTRSSASTVSLLSGERCGPDCGKVLVVGGQTSGGPENSFEAASTSELYDPVLNLWTLLDSIMQTSFENPRASVISGTACAPMCGRVLVTGGKVSDPSDSLVYNPSERTWTTVSNRCMRCDTGGRDLVSLPDGRVLALRENPVFPTLVVNPMRVFVPSRNEWADAKPVPSGCSASGGCGFTASRLADGKILVAGGRLLSDPPAKESNVYDPATNEWAAADPMSVPRRDASAVRLDRPKCEPRCDKVLVVGGGGGGEGTAELYG